MQVSNLWSEIYHVFICCLAIFLFLVLFYFIERQSHLSSLNNPERSWSYKELIGDINDYHLQQ